MNTTSNPSDLRKGQAVTITFQGAQVTAHYLEWSDKYNLAIVDYNGRRLHRNLKSAGPANGARIEPQGPTNNVTADEPDLPKFSVAERFEFLESFSRMVGLREANSLVVTGEGGLGKSFTVEAVLKELGLEEIDPSAVNGDAAGYNEDAVAADEEADKVEKQTAAKGDYRIIKGYSTPKAMYRSLWENADKLVIFDDCDSVLNNPTAVNILKGALDSKEERKISWLSEGGRLDDELPKQFVFSGSVIFISNLRLEDVPQPLLSRALTVDLSMTSTEKVERMRTIVSAIKDGLTLTQKETVVAFIEKHKDQVGDLNMRTYLKVAKIMKASPKSWERAAEYMITAL